jgi:hypothetical protein
MEAIVERSVDLSPMMVKMVFDSWNSLIKQFNEVLDSVTDDQLQKQIAPNKNRGIYVLGHMIAVHDDMLPILGFGELQYPEINEVFKSPDNAEAKIPSAATLRSYWKEIGNTLDRNIKSMQPEQWFEKHTSVSAEDFATQPHRNKLNVMITRTCHLSYHLGQMKWVQ